MAQEIKRTIWSRFCKRFSTVNRYRQTTLEINGVADPATFSVEPFLGIALTKNGRRIDGVQFFAGNPEPEKVIEPVLTIKDPSQILLEKDDGGRDLKLRIRASDGSEAVLQVNGEPENARAKFLTENMAYRLFERRGRQFGNDWDDWFAAEQKVREAAEALAE